MLEKPVPILGHSFSRLLVFFFVFFCIENLNSCFPLSGVSLSYQMFGLLCWQDFSTHVQKISSK